MGNKPRKVQGKKGKVSLLYKIAEQFKLVKDLFFLQEK